jgi:hypothetical protein
MKYVGIKGKIYPTGKNHPAWKADRNEQLVKDRFPNWPATGTIGLSYPEICIKYKITEGRVHTIIRRMKLEYFGREE